MDDSRSFHACRALYRRLVGLYPKAFRERFSESMLQTFDDLYRAEPGARRRLDRVLLRAFVDTAKGLSLERLRWIGTTMKNAPIATAGLALLLPFGTLIAFLFSWQLLHAIGYAGPANLRAVAPPTTRDFVLIFVCPPAALLINLISVTVGAIKAGPSATLRIPFAKANLFTLVVVILSAGVTVFLFGHDAIPCLAHGTFRDGVRHIWPLIKSCSAA